MPTVRHFRWVMISRTDFKSLPIHTSKTVTAFCCDCFSLKSGFYFQGVYKSHPKGYNCIRQGGEIMDLIKIGRYIAEKRKNLGMTQRQLAEKLGMSDKSVSKWERGVCLPDVSVYSELCRILGISINEFLAGEDIPQESILQKSEKNIIDVTVDSKKKQHRLKSIICGFAILSLLAIFMVGITVYRQNRPQNFIGPVERDSIEMETAALFSGPDGAHIYKFTTTDTYQSFHLFVSEYHAGQLMDRRNIQLGFDGIGSPENGAILIFPDFKNFVIKIVISDTRGSRYSTEIPILKDVPDRMYYGRSSSSITESTAIQYNEEQPLLALIYDNDEMWVIDLNDLTAEESDTMAENDFVYYFSLEFEK